MRKRILTITIILLIGSDIVAQIHMPALKDSRAGLEIKQDPTLKNDLIRPVESTDFQWHSFPSPTTDGVTQACIASDGSEMVIHYRKPRPSLNIDEGIVEKWTGSNWAVQANLSNECHEPDVDIDGSVVVATWYDDGYDYGYGTNVNGNWVTFTGTYLVSQWFPRAAMAMGLPYMSFTSKYSDGVATNYDMLHIRNIVGVGEQIELNGGWRVTYTSVGLRTDITGDDDAWYCVFSQQEYLYVMKGAIVNGTKEYTDLGDGFRMYNPVSHPEIVLYQGNPVVGWFENANTELYIAAWNGSQWMVLGAGSAPAGSFYFLRMAASSSYLYVAYASTESDTAISVNLYDGEQWYVMPPVQDYLNSDIGTVDIAVHNDEPVVAFTENNLLTVKKFTSQSITNTTDNFTGPQWMLCYPNPTHDLITIQVGRTGIFSVDISNLTGQVIQTIYFNGKSKQIDLYSYPKGVYFIIIKTEGFIATRRIIKL
ncbi:MAG: hypothetical protein AMS23_01565 [Bacteroides sp. SM1_62]|nr:MAG: hypothetical protein AMS23_01565 [Bacteroides sp. SM1_62]